MISLRSWHTATLYPDRLSDKQGQGGCRALVEQILGAPSKGLLKQSNVEVGVIRDSSEMFQETPKTHVNVRALCYAIVLRPEIELPGEISAGFLLGK